MKFTVDRATLQSALQQLGKVVPPRSTLPVLGSVLFLTEDGKLSLRATDLEISQVIYVSAEVSDDGSVAIPHRTLLEITSEMPEGDLQIEASDSNQVTLTSSYGSYSIMGRPIEEFPALPIIDTKQSVSIPASMLKRVIDKTIFAVSREELKPSLQGVLFKFGESSLGAVATDGHRLVKYTHTGFSGGGYVGEHILPTKFLSILGNLLGDEESTQLNIGENHILIQSRDTVLYTRIIEDRYPDYESVIPDENEQKLTTNREALLAAVRRVGIFSNKMTHQITLSLSGDGLTVSTEDAEMVSKGEETLPCEYSGESMTIGYNANYLRDVVSHLDGETVVGTFNSSVTAAVFSPEVQEDNEEITMLLMPIRLND